MKKLPAVPTERLAITPCDIVVASMTLAVSSALVLVALIVMLFPWLVIENKVDAELAVPANGRVRVHDPEPLETGCQPLLP